ncbi:hypothetical protein F3Y22_tig00000340pilonHSYRG01378 [Hibiscus syriacus]|uniref:Uncharacterized protein n=1 Tax=Hibiscus syriacus TaxID=106335 RepID=A0A6A3D290_HIBSY|nr:hypothetical protein F3Y22_tig00000340pilonHSYRG01378 [Hibiscus syriacus]
MYGKVVVSSKVPLPNYRPDLDDKRPQRELHSGKVRENSDDANSQVEYANSHENPDSFLDNSIMETVLQMRSLRLCNMQRAWQV